MKYKLILVFGVFLVSFAGVFVKMTDVEPSVIAMYRLSIGGLLLLPFVIKYKTYIDLKLSDIKYFLLAGFVISLHYFTWFTALNKTSVTSSTLIICTEPLVALAFSYLLYKDKISKSQFLTILIALVGVGIVAWGDVGLSEEAIIGDALTFLAVVFFVVYLFIGEKVVKKYSFVLYTAILFLFASIVLLIYNLIMGFQIFGYSKYNYFILLLIAVIPNIGQLIFNYVLNYIKPTLISASILLEPICATIIAVIFLKDSVFFNQMIGGLIIIMSVLVYIKRDNTNFSKQEVTNE